MVAALRERLPAERILFFADVARAPYSNRSPGRVRHFVHQLFHAVQHLRPKHVVLADDVMASVAMVDLQQRSGGVAVTGCLDPAARAAVDVAGASDRPTIGVLASPLTIEARLLERALVNRRYRAGLVMRSAAALEAIIPTAAGVEDPLLQLAAARAIQPMIDKHVDVLLLAGSSLTWCRKLLQSLAGKSMQVVDASRAIADDVARRLARQQLLHPDIRRDVSSIRWYLTDESPEMFDRAERLAGFELPPPTIIGLDELELLDLDPRLRSAS